MKPARIATSPQTNTKGQWTPFPEEEHCGYAVQFERSTIDRILVSVVDDDESVRESLPELLKQFGFAARAFSSAEEFLASEYIDQTRCLILDVAMPGMSGPDLQQELIRRPRGIPIIFITADRDMIVRERLMEQGAAECLFKPFSDMILLDAVNSALHPK